MDEKKSDKNPCKPKKAERVSVHLPPEIAEELDEYVLENGYGSRSAAIQLLMRNQLRQAREERARSEHIEATDAGRMVKTEGGGWTYTSIPYDELSMEQFEEQLAHEARQQERSFDFARERLIWVQEDEGSGSRVFSVSLFEDSLENTPTRKVRIRSYWKMHDGNVAPLERMTVPRSWVKWLIEALQNSEVAANEESSKNRRRAHEKRAARTPAEIEREKELRALYVERYSKTRVAWAVTLAGRHRARAIRRKLTEHFTAWEWLDLCAKHDFGCACCQSKERIELHHRRELATGGANTIDNIEPLCQECHKAVSSFDGDYARRCLAEQQQLCEDFAIGDAVIRRFSKALFGVVVQIMAPKDDIYSLWPKIERAVDGTITRMSRWASQDLKAQARVLWPAAGKRKARETIVDLEDLVRFEEAS